MEYILWTKTTSLRVTGTKTHINKIEFLAREPKASPDKNNLNGLWKDCISQLIDYLNGNLNELNFPIDFIGTKFQKEVWCELRKIPFGTTLSYGELAKRIGRPKALRAIGTACGKNPLVLIIPCHRVVAKCGPGGFAGGLELKRQLLYIEGVTLTI